MIADSLVPNSPSTASRRSPSPCTGEAFKCGICASYCPVQCIKTDNEGYYVPDYDYCKGCGICVNECPKKTISMQLEEK